MLWSMVSKVADKSRRQRHDNNYNCPFTDKVLSDTKFNLKLRRDMGELVMHLCDTVAFSALETHS